GVHLRRSLACCRGSAPGHAAVLEAACLAAGLANERGWLRNRCRRHLAVRHGRFCVLRERSADGRREGGIRLCGVSRRACGRARRRNWEYHSGSRKLESLRGMSLIVMAASQSSRKLPALAKVYVG